jgi:CPA2 family monovalent cation:H+ antiporter-2
VIDETPFILNLGVAVAVALVGGAVARRLGQPPLVGYLLAGVVIGPFTPGFVGDVEQISVLAEVGIVLLLFALGVEFSIRELVAVRKVALGAAVLQIAIVLGIGGAFMLVTGADPRAAFLVGAVVSISSTLVVAKGLEERGELDSLHGRNAIGWMIVQDIATILFIVALPPIAGENPDLTPLLLALGKGAVFLALAFVAGTRLLPAVFALIARLGSPELFLLAVVATALLTAFVSSAVFGLSLALGAFVAGVIVSESELSHQAAAEVIPFRDLFAVLFFVATGMLVDPAGLVAQVPFVLALAVIGVLVKGVVSVGAARAFGLPLRSAILLGAAIAQVGEFSLILAQDGLELELIDQATYNAILGATIVTIAFTAPVRLAAERASAWVESRETERSAEALVSGGAAGTTPPAMSDADGGQPAPRPRVAGRIPGGPRSRTEEAFAVGDVGRRRIVVIGAGRVGRIVVRAVRARSFACTVIDRDRGRLDEAARLGAEILYGDAARPEILRQARLQDAQVLIITVGDPLTARLVAERARQIHPGLAISSRVRGTTQMEALQKAGVQRLASPEAEAAFELARHALQRMGVSAPELAAITARLRKEAYR